jgi:hypothetical protein
MKYYRCSLPVDATAAATAPPTTGLHVLHALSTPSFKPLQKCSFLLDLTG